MSRRPEIILVVSIPGALQPDSIHSPGDWTGDFAIVIREHPRGRSIALKAALAAGEVQIGTFLFELANPSIPRILANAGFDFVVIDMEHGCFTTESAARLISAASASGISPLVRVPEITRTNVLRALDAGSCGIMAPMIRDRSDVERLYALAKYPPEGQRGTCFGIAHTGYRLPDPATYLEEANDNVLLVGQIETPEALSQITSILTADLLDVAFIGPLDLSVSLGAPGDLGSPSFDAAVSDVLEACAKHDVAAGAFASNPLDAAQWIGRGCRMIACSGELCLLSEKSREVVEEIRQAL